MGRLQRADGGRGRVRAGRAPRGPTTVCGRGRGVATLKPPPHTHTRARGSARPQLRSAASPPSPRRACPAAFQPRSIRRPIGPPPQLTQCDWRQSCPGPPAPCARVPAEERGAAAEERWDGRRRGGQCGGRRPGGRADFLPGLSAQGFRRASRRGCQSAAHRRCHFDKCISRNIENQGS